MVRRVLAAAAALSIISPATAGAQAIPSSPSLASTLSPAVAQVPGIVAFLQSSTPKTVQFDANTGEMTWVGTGSAIWTGRTWSYQSAGATVAGTFRVTPNSSASPAFWPRESPAAATSAVTGGASPEIQSQSPCANQDFCLYAESPYATYGFWQTGSEFVSIPYRTGYYTGKWTGYIETNDATYPTYGPGTTVEFSSPSVQTATFIDIES